MKKIIFFSFIFSLFFPDLKAQKIHKQELSTDIKSIVVYLYGGEITREKQISLKKGRNLLIFKDISPKLNVKGIRVSTNEDIPVLAISSKLNFITNVAENPRTKQLRDSLDLIDQRLNLLSDQENGFLTEKSLLEKNISLGGEQNGVELTELKEAADFYRQRITEINKSITKIKRSRAELTKNQYKLKSELKELNAESNYSRYQISILVSSEKQKDATITLKYLVDDAGWSPSYDIRASEVDQPVDFIYRAQVFNNTSIPWDDVNLTLSTGDPNLSAAQPSLKPWYLTFSGKQLYSKRGAMMTPNLSQVEGYTQNRVMEKSEGLDLPAQEQTEEIYREIEVSQLSAEFKIPTPYTIPADNKPYLVDVDKHQLNADYRHFSIPKLDRDAFLIASIIGWEDLNLVEGPAHVYFDGSYVGVSYVNTRNVKDTLDLSLGRDKKVIVTRSKLKNYSSTKFIGSKRKETLAYEMIIKNNRKKDINVELQDQIPISQNEDIEVEELDISNGSLNENTGIITWNLNLKPGESKKLQLKFEIKYPKNTVIHLKQSKKQRMRMF